MQAPLPANEHERLNALRALGILDTPPEERFDRITRVAQAIFRVPVALISLVDADRQWHKSRQGLDACEVPRDLSFCAHALGVDGALVVADASRDPRFAAHPLVLGAPHIRFYAGHQLNSPEGYTYGTLCLIDIAPRDFAAPERALLADLAAWAEGELNNAALNSALAARRESEARLGAVIDATGEGMALVSPDRRFLTINRRFADLFGVTQDEIIGLRFDEIAPHVERSFADPAILRQIVAGSADDPHREFSALVAQRWPRERELRLASVPVHGAAGDFLGRLFVFRDVTREHETERLKTAFISRMSHELRTPLTSIKGFTDLLVDGEAGPIGEEQREFLEIIADNTGRLAALIDDLLDISRLDTGRLTLKCAPLDLSRLLHGVADALRPRLAAESQTVSLDLPTDLPPISGDHDRVTQICRTLFVHAHHDTPRGGTIRCVAARDGAMVRIAFQDGGAGLTPEEREQFFTNFFPAGRRTAGEAGRAGVDLAIARALIELHGGEIAVSSAPTTGTTLSFTLPIAPIDPSGGATHAADGGGR